MSEFIDNISQFIQYQFPRLYREQEGVELTESRRSVLVDFVESYFEFIEENYGEHFLRNRKMFDNRDIDSTVDEFIEYFKLKYVNNLPFVSATDDRFLVKNILDFYRSKGSPQSIKLLIRLLFNEEADVYYPGKDVLRASDSKWVDPKYIEVLSSPRSVSFVNKKIFGSVSGAEAFVEAIVTKRVNNRLIDIIYLSNINGDFVRGDIVSDDGVLENAPKVIGSLSSVTVNRNSVGNNSIGDIYNVISDFGQEGTVRVTKTAAADGSVDFEIEDGGYGYTLDDTTLIFTSDIVVLKDNTTPVFQDKDIVRQQNETIYLDADDEFINSVNQGDLLAGVDSSNTQIANGVILETGEEQIENVLFPFVRVQAENNDTFMNKRNITFTSNVDYIDNRQLVEGSDLSLSIVSSNGVFANGEIVYYRELSPTSNNISERYAFGEVTFANSTVVELTDSFGDFLAGDQILSFDSNTNASILSVDTIYEGVSNRIISKTSPNSYSVIIEEGDYSGTRKVRGQGSKVVAEIANVVSDSVVTISSNSITATVNAVANTYYTGRVIGQDDESIAIGSSSNNDFIFVQGKSELLNQNNEEITVDEIGTGFGASFKIGSLSNEEVISTTVDKIIDENISEVQYEDILISGSGSGLGFVSAINIFDGGTGYSNSSNVDFIGGGYEDQQPLIQARGNVITDSNGSITSVEITENGEGYFLTPDISISDGSGANVEIEMTFGYGFPGNPFSNINTIISEALTDANVTIGTIASLKEERRGRNYTERPFTLVENPLISAFSNRDQLAQITVTDGVFQTDEIVVVSNTDVRGLLKSANSTFLSIRNLSFDEDFEANDSIVGTTSGAQGIINSISYDETAEVMGDNAVIDTFVISQDGTLDEVQVVTSGIGYVDGEDVILKRGDKEVSGISFVELQGKGEGYWETRTSHLNSEKKLHDNDYYQEYSYDIKTGVNISEYREIVLDILHLAGTKLFSTVVKTTEEETTPSAESTIKTGI
jgi:hypothetical protein